MKSAAPKSSIRIRRLAQAISYAFHSPAADSISGTISRVPSRTPRSRSAAPISASTRAISSADSTFGTTMPSSSGHTTAAMSSAPWSAEKPVLAAITGFTRTYTRPPSAARGAAAVTFALAPIFWANGTESSRSRITPSAPHAPTLASFRGSLPGANSRDVTTIQLSGSPCRRRHSTADCSLLAGAGPVPAAAPLRRPRFRGAGTRASAPRRDAPRRRRGVCLEDSSPGWRRTCTPAH